MRIKLALIPVIDIEQKDGKSNCKTAWVCVGISARSVGFGIALMRLRQILGCFREGRRRDGASGSNLDTGQSLFRKAKV